MSVTGGGLGTSWRSYYNVTMRTPIPHNGSVGKVLDGRYNPKLVVELGFLGGASKQTPFVSVTTHNNALSFELLVAYLNIGIRHFCKFFIH